MKLADLFWNASQEEVKKGFIETETDYVCLLCGMKIEKGIIYPVDDVLYDAQRYIRIHIRGLHQSVFEHLIHLDKRLTGLTDHQNRLLQLFFQGKSDGEIQKEMGIGSASTIRNHRFVLKEKERQAKVFLAIMELLKEKDKQAPAFITFHKTARMTDERYNITEAENDKILRKYFPEGVNGPLKSFDMKEKNKLVVLREIAKRFKTKKIYTEKEVNEILKPIYHDHNTLRRYLIEYGFMSRKNDGSRYWLNGDLDATEGKKMERKKELKLQYREMKTEAGVYQIKNTQNGKVLVVGTPNLKTMNGRTVELRRGGHYNRQLQEEWNRFGESAFIFEVLEVLKEKAESHFNQQEELKILEEKWLEKLKPYGERGYHQPKNEVK